jgi:hypothetical protein
VHLENTVKMQDIELDKREEQIVDLWHLVHDLQIQVPPTPKEDLDEDEPVSRVEDG